jgi:DNA-binding response OmpR family regulator
MKVLVVDDDQTQRELRALLLGQSGFTTVEASDKITARRLALEHRPGAAVVDLRLPRIEDGLELIRDLKAMDSTMRVIVLTGKMPASFASWPEAAMVDDLLIKPSPTAELIRTLRSYE